MKVEALCSIMSPIQTRSLLLVAVLWYDPPQQRCRRYITFTLLFQINTRNEVPSLHSATVTQQPSLFGGQSRARRSHPHQRFSPTLSIALKHSWASAEKHSQGHIPERAHHVSYLTSIELFQMKCTAVSHSPGLRFACRLACMIHLFSCGRFAAGLLRCCSTRNTVRKVCSSLLELKVHTGHGILCSLLYCCPNLLLLFEVWSLGSVLEQQLRSEWTRHIQNIDNRITKSFDFVQMIFRVLQLGIQTLFFSFIRFLSQDI